VEAAIGVLQTAIQKLNSVAVDTVDLRERNRVSNPIEGYTQNVAPREQGLAVHPGQDITRHD
jgi:DNA polymerase I